MFAMSRVRPAIAPETIVAATAAVGYRLAGNQAVSVANIDDVVVDHILGKLEPLGIDHSEAVQRAA